MTATEKRDFSLSIQQEEALKAIGEALLDGTRSGYVEMATSTGKTAIEALVTEAAVRAGKRVLIIAPTINIVDQIVGKNPENATGIERFTSLNQTADVRTNAGGRKGTSTADVVVTTYSGFLNDYKNGGAELGKFGVVIADECHRSLGEATADALKNAYPGAVKLGFSATPDYAVDRTSDEVYDTSLFEFSLVDAIESGRTAPLRTLLYTTGETLTTSSPGDFSEKELAPLAGSMSRNATAVELTQAFVRDGRQGIIACIPGNTNYHARLLSQFLREGGVRAADVGSHLSVDEMDAVLKRYNNGEIDVLTFTRSLEEGWDSDKASFAVNLAPTTSPVRTKQLMGRVLRKKPDDDLDSIYVDFVDSSTGKQPYTAMHALGLEDIDFRRTLGRPVEGGGQWKIGDLSSLEHVSKRLYNRLLGLQGKLVQEVTLRPLQDPLIKLWDDKLGKEGLDGGLEYNDVLPPSLNRRIEEAYGRHLKDNDQPPTTDELLDIMDRVSKDRRLAMGHYGVRVAMDAIKPDDLIADENSDPYTQAAAAALREALSQVIDHTLSPQEAGVISMRFGLVDGEPKHYDEIGKIYRITQGRIRQIESIAMSKLRHPVHLHELAGFLRDVSDELPTYLER